MLVLGLVNEQLKLLVPGRLGGVLLDLSLQLSLVPHKQPTADIQFQVSPDMRLPAVDAWAALVYVTTSLRPEEQRYCVFCVFWVVIGSYK